MLGDPTASLEHLTPVAEDLVEIHGRFREEQGGSVADYIPELGKADPSLFGIAVATVDGAVHQVGDAEEPFTIQSISKPFVFAQALQEHGREAVLARVGVEPTGDAFNSIIIDEGTRRPFNPMVNAGAIVTAGLVKGPDVPSRIESAVRFMSRMAGRALEVDERVFASERETGDRNRAISYLMRGFGMLADVDDVLDVYFTQCSVLVTCRDLAVMAATLANGGVNPITGERTLDAAYVENVLSVMATCGMYDFAGEWLYTVGLPAKSGVAGGVIAVLPGQLGIGVFSPPLDERGNSVRGIAVCQELSRRYHLHQYRPGLVSTDGLARRYRGTAVRSRRSRAADEVAILDREAGRIVVYELRGELSFAPTERLVRAVTADLGDADYTVLDFRRTTGIDEVSLGLLRRLAEAAERRGVRMLAGYAPEGLEGMDAFADTDSALQAAEDLLLGRLQPPRIPPRVPLAEQDLLQGLPAEVVAALGEAVTLRSVPEGEVVLREGDPAEEIYFVAEGSVRAELALEGGGARRLNTMGAGVAFGELALLDKGPRSATIVAEEDTVLYILPFSALESLELTHPGVTATLYQALGRLLVQRLRRATDQIRALDR